MIPKFRAWDTINECMCNVDLMNLYDEFYKFKCFGKDKSIAGIADFNDKSVILMQYTGLKDKKGVEIYEGDILLSTASENRNDWKKWQVHYEDGSFLIDCKEIQKDKRRRKKHEVEILCEDNVWLYCLEVKGNIYENPELMEDKR